MIWNKSELLKIKQLILNKANFHVNENNQLMLNNKISQNDIDYNFTKSKTSNYVYNIANEEIYKLFNIKDRQEIINIFSKLKNIEFDKNNSLHFGLIACLSKIDFEDHTYIFTILREIISQFERVTSDVVNNSIKDATYADDILIMIKKIENNSEVTYEEREIGRIMNIILGYAPGLREVDVYNSLIKKEFSNIRNRILFDLKQIYSNKRKKEEHDKKADCLNHKIDFGKKCDHLSLLKTKRTGKHSRPY